MCRLKMRNTSLQSAVKVREADNRAGLSSAFFPQQQSGGPVVCGSSSERSGVLGITSSSGGSIAHCKLAGSRRQVKSRSLLRSG
jgi:hypothetical protein